VGVAIATWKLDLWRWKIEAPTSWRAELSGYFELLVWFTWPAGPLSIWTLWRWRHQLASRSMSRHLATPAWIVFVVVISTFSTGSSDRNLLLALPAFAALAAFALPTLQRQVASLIDWFTLLFFSTCGLTIWVVWIAMQTGFPPQPAVNVARLAPGFEPGFSTLAFGMAGLATLAWAWLVKWRVGRHRAAIWKSLVLPGCGAALCWLLLMTLWLPLLNYTQSYTALVKQVSQVVNQTNCAQVKNLSAGTITSLRYYGKLKLEAANQDSKCDWLLTTPVDHSQAPQEIDLSIWKQHKPAIHPADANLAILIFERNH
jgi:4-amino-4-deoxy-L-arabinose transferase-like glycosyltransferase